MAETLIRYSLLPSYAEFAKDCLGPNRPALLPASAIEHWGVNQAWGLRSCRTTTTTTDFGLDSTFSVLEGKYGDHQVPLVSQRRDLSSEERTTRPLREGIDMMRISSGDPVYYAKDWHLFRQEDELRGQNATAARLYTVLPYFQDDWMNHPAVIVGRDDFRFCYAGQRGTQTPLHADVYQSYSWSTNLVGTKRWRMFPPRVVCYMRQMDKEANDGNEAEECDARTSQLAKTVDQMDRWASEGRLGTFYAPLVEDGHAGWPRWHLARNQMIEFTQNAGETVFVPSGWVHEVMNLTDCVSINHNWCNSYNVPALYQALCEEVSGIEQCMDDVRQMLQDNSTDQDDWRNEWVQIVQSMSEGDLGWGWRGFWSMVLPNLCDADQNPEVKPDAQEFVVPRIRSLLIDFATRNDALYLDPATRQLVEQCREQVGLAPTT